MIAAVQYPKTDYIGNYLVNKLTYSASPSGVEQSRAKKQNECSRLQMSDNDFALWWS